MARGRKIGMRPHRKDGENSRAKERRESRPGRLVKGAHLSPTLCKE
jgi:hypothetical protein